MMKRTIYLHIGNNYSVDVRDVVGIFDMDNTTVSGITNRLLDKAEKQREGCYAAYERPKSFIVTANGGSARGYVSQLAAGTL